MNIKVKSWRGTNIFSGVITDKDWKKLQKDYSAKPITFIYTQENTYRDVGGRPEKWFSIPLDKLKAFLGEK